MDGGALDPAIVQFGAFGLLAYIIAWLTKDFSKKLDELNSNIKALNKTIVQLEKVVSFFIEDKLKEEKDK